MPNVGGLQRVSGLWWLQVWSRLALLLVCLAVNHLHSSLSGWNDSQTGPLLLRMQANYHLTYTIVSLIFVFAFLGFLTACLSNVWLTDRLGFGKVSARPLSARACHTEVILQVITLGASCQVVAYAIQASAPPFPVFCLSFFISGVGMGLQDAQANTLIATLDLVDGKTTRMSCLHAAYGKFS